MIFPNTAFEIEFRCHFSSVEEAYHLLPFLRASLITKYSWVDTYYGLGIFESGQVLRVSKVSSDTYTKYFLGWKGPDIGGFANIRRELNEDITNGIINSAIMEWLSGTEGDYTLKEVIEDLERLGYKRFMSYQGVNLAGRAEPISVNVKLMHCGELKWPLLVEMEKIAWTEAEASEYERELKDLCKRYQLGELVVKEEPGTLLHEKYFDT